MRIALISDIHGNYPAARVVFDQIKQHSCDLIISLGDIAGYYCYINECIDICREHSVINIMGNHDYYLTSGEPCERSVTVNNCIDYQKSIITHDNFSWLAKSCNFLKNDKMWLVHGGWKNYLEEYITDFDFDNLPDKEITLYASGHTHVQLVEKKDNVTYLNPGSVGQPRDLDRRTAFAIIDDSSLSVELVRTEYNIDEIEKAMKSIGFEERYYSCLRYGKSISPFKKT